MGKRAATCRRVLGARDLSASPGIASGAVAGGGPPRPCLRTGWAERGGWPFAVLRAPVSCTGALAEVHINMHRKTGAARMATSLESGTAEQGLGSILSIGIPTSDPDSVKPRVTWHPARRLAQTLVRQPVPRPGCPRGDADERRPEDPPQHAGLSHREVPRR